MYTQSRLNTDQAVLGKQCTPRLNTEQAVLGKQCTPVHPEQIKQVFSWRGSAVIILKFELWFYHIAVCPSDWDCITEVDLTQIPTDLDLNCCPNVSVQRVEYKHLSWVWGADRKNCLRVFVWHHKAMLSDAKRWSRGTDFSPNNHMIDSFSCVPFDLQHLILTWESPSTSHVPIL